MAPMPQIYFVSLLQQLLLLHKGAKVLNERGTYDGGGGEEPLIRFGRLACPGEIDTPLDLNEMLLTDETRSRVVTFIASCL